MKLTTHLLNTASRQGVYRHLLGLGKCDTRPVLAQLKSNSLKVISWRIAPRWDIKGTLNLLNLTYSGTRLTILWGGLQCCNVHCPHIDARAVKKSKVGWKYKILFIQNNPIFFTLDWSKHINETRKTDVKNLSKSHYLSM